MLYSSVLLVNNLMGDFRLLGRLLMYSKNNSGFNIVFWGILDVIWVGLECFLLYIIVWE